MYLIHNILNTGIVLHKDFTDNVSPYCKAHTIVLPIKYVVSRSSINLQSTSHKDTQCPSNILIVQHKLTLLIEVSDKDLKITQNWTKNSYGSNKNLKN